MATIYVAYGCLWYPDISRFDVQDGKGTRGQDGQFCNRYSAERWVSE